MDLADIRPWHIYVVPNCQHTLPDPKDKLIVAVGIEIDTIYGFLINSNVHPFVSARPALLVCQAYILAAQHPCLDYNSSIDCRTAFPFSASEIEGVRDRVHPDALLSIFDAVHDCKVLRDDRRTMIRESARKLIGKA